MSTRACYRFIDRPGDGAQVVTIYKHSDGYPEGAVCWITRAIDFAWPLPRFEADEFAASFVAANKKSARQRHAAYVDHAERETDPAVKAHLLALAEDWAPEGRYARLGTGGDLRIVNRPGLEAFRSYAADIAFLYDVTVQEEALHVTACSVRDQGGEWAIRQLFAGSLLAMQARYGLRYLDAA